jgi:hypothetical protein
MLRCLARSVHRFGPTLAQRAVMVDARKAEIGERQPAQLGQRIVGRERATAHVVE